MEESNKMEDKLVEVISYIKTNLPQRIKAKFGDSFELRVQLSFHEENTFVNIDYTRKHGGYVDDRKIAMLWWYNVDKYKKLIDKEFEFLNMNLDVCSADYMHRLHSRYEKEKIS